MATTKYKIAEQVLRIVNGGDPTEDSSIDIREVMLLVDQERDALIKSEITDWMYTKSTTTAKGELEINGGWISTAVLPLLRDGVKNGLVFAPINFSYVSLPNDMGIVRVETTDARFQPAKYRYVVTGQIGPTTYNTSDIEILFTFGPKVLDKKYTISFDFHITKTLMSDGVTETHQYGGVRTHKIQFNIDTSGFDSFEKRNVDFLKALTNSPGFKKFIKDFDIKYGMPDLGTSNFTFDSSTITYQTAAVSLETNYGSRIDNFTVNGVGDNGTDDGGDNEYGGIAIGLNTEILNDIGLGWVIQNKGGSENSAEALITANDNAHGIGFMINDTMYTSEFVAPVNAPSESTPSEVPLSIGSEDMVDLFIQEHAYKLSRDQNIKVRKSQEIGPGSTPGTTTTIGFVLQFEEIYPMGGFNIQPFTPGNAFVLTYDATGSLPYQNTLFGSKGFKPIVFTRMPNGGEHSPLYDKSVRKSGRQYYYIENQNPSVATVPGTEATSLGDTARGTGIYFYKKYDLTNLRWGELVKVQYIGTSTNFSDHVLYPIPADYEKIIIRNLVELLTIMKNASDDMTNDNID